MKIGIDLGRTVYDPVAKQAYPNALDVVTEMVNNGNEVFIISRVNSDQRERSLKWLASVDFFNYTGVKESNLYYCFERKDKALFARALGLEAFIDDRLDVLLAMDANVEKFWMMPSDTERIKNFDDLVRNGIKIVNNWNEASFVEFF